tara:strand:- start:1224 stop:1613 length:390 start_codon:yes stop_codon:yes gene_type:complete
MITIGELDTPVIIQKPTYTANANYGGVQRATWGHADAEITSVWAYRIYKGGGEREEGDQKVGEQKVDFYIRWESYKDTIRPNWRIRVNVVGGGGGSTPSAYYYYIEKIAHIDGRHKMTRLTAVEKDNDN